MWATGGPQNTGPNGQVSHCRHNRYRFILPHSFILSSLTLPALAFARIKERIMLEVFVNNLLIVGREMMVNLNISITLSYYNREYCDRVKF